MLLIEDYSLVIFDFVFQTFKNLTHDCDLVSNYSTS